jgi:guanyl-specific ribonuclease Sa
MLKNIISAIFLITAMASSTAAMAENTQTTESVNLALISSETSTKQDENVLAQAATDSLQAEETSNVPAAATGWMFTFALIGFVLLSNRRGV